MNENTIRVVDIIDDQSAVIHNLLRLARYLDADVVEETDGPYTVLLVVKYQEVLAALAVDNETGLTVVSLW